MSPELKLQFQQKIYELHINSSMGVDEKNIEKIYNICYDLFDFASNLKDEWLEGNIHQPPEKQKSVIAFSVEENDTIEATKELRTRVKPHRPEK